MGHYSYDRRTAGLFEPPPAMVAEIGEWVLAQIAANSIGKIEGQIDELKDHRKKLEPSFKALQDSMKALKKLLKASGSRDLFRAYKLFYEQSLYHFGFTGIRQLKMKDFSGIKDPKRRKELANIVKDAFDLAEERIEGRLLMGDVEIKKHRVTIKEFKKYTKSGVKPMKGDDVTKEFPLKLDDWYIDQKAVLKIRDRALERAERARQHIQKHQEEKGEVGPDIRQMLDDLLTSAKKTWKAIPVKLMRKIDSQRALAYWQPMKKMIVIQIPQWGSAAQLERELIETLSHELKHMGQSLMADMLEGDTFFLERNPGPGMPSKHIMTPQYRQKGKPKPSKGIRDIDLHHLDDVEFYTDLADNIKLMTREIKDKDKRQQTYDLPPLTEEEKKAIFSRQVGREKPRAEHRELLHFISVNRFFMALKKHARGKWKKAVSEAYKKLFQGGAPDRVAMRYLMERF